MKKKIVGEMMRVIDSMMTKAKVKKEKKKKKKKKKNEEW